MPVALSCWTKAKLVMCTLVKGGGGNKFTLDKPKKYNYIRKKELTWDLQLLEFCKGCLQVKNAVRSLLNLPGGSSIDGLRSDGTLMKRRKYI